MIMETLPSPEVTSPNLPQPTHSAHRSKDFPFETQETNVVLSMLTSRVFFFTSVMLVTHTAVVNSLSLAQAVCISHCFGIHLQITKPLT